MNFVLKTEQILRKSVPLVLLLAGPFVVWSAAQQKPRTQAPAPHASAPHANAPASRPSNNRPSNNRPSNNRPSNNRPSNAMHPSNSGARTGNTTANRPGNATANRTGTVAKGGTGTTTGRPGTGTGAKNGTSTAGNGRGPVGKTGAPSGVNRAGGPNAAKGGNAGGGRSVNRPAPVRQVSLKGGGTATIRPNGQIRSINRNGMQINHGLNGSRRIESTHNGARIVSTGKKSGYVQRAYVTRNGRTYVSRTVVVNNVTYTSVYRSYSYGGYCCYYGYHPAYYYAPAYYGWAYNPWPAPVYYGWGWGGAPWYGYYGGYFAPYPVYPSAAFWLTDYLIAANLQAAYQAQAAANAAAANNAASANNAPADQSQGDGDGGASASNSGTVALSPEVKAAIAEEVKAQLAAEQASAKPAASTGSPQPTAPSAEEVPPALDPARRTFVVSSDLAVSGDGQECQLTSGDVITRITDTPDEDRKVTVSVSASKKADCAPGKQVAVGVDDLQEMHNHFQEQLDNGMKELSSKQGNNGLPKAPDPAPVASDVPPPPSDKSAEKALQDQQAAADQTEAQVVKEAFSQGS